MVDRLITLFESSDRDFSTNGIGPLPDAVSCDVSEERNGPYELEMEYPITGRYYNEIQFRRILYTKPNAYSNRQPFRIYAISKPINGIVTVNAQHISYDLADYSVSPFHATTVGEAFELLKYSMDDSANCPFTFYTDKTTEANMGFNVPMNARTILGGIEGSILDKYRGEYEWDGYLVKFLENRGENRGVTIRYGKNMTDIRQEESMSDVYTAIRPYWYREPNNVQTEYDPQTGEESEPINTEDDNSGLVQLTSTVSRNLISGTVKYGDDNTHTKFDSDGTIIETTDETKIMYAKIQNGVKYTIRCDTTEETVPGGFFTDVPAVGSEPVNGLENISVGEFTSEIDGYLAFIVANDYSYSIVDRLPYHMVFVDPYAEYTRVLPVDLTSEFETKPTEDELAVMALIYIAEHDLGVPKVSIEVSFVNLTDSEEYKDIALLETVKLCDTVKVLFPKLGVNATAKVVKTNYDVLAGRYSSIELGSVKSDLATTVAVSRREAEEKVSSSDLSAAVKEATRLITGQTGGYVVLNPPEHPQEILIMNKPTIAESNKIWRWNNKGLGYASSPEGTSAYYGEYGLAITSDGTIVADFIKSGAMSAARIFGGQLVLGGTTEDSEGNPGSLIVYGDRNKIIGQFNKNGLFLWGENGFYLIAHPDIGFAGMQMMSGHTSPTPVPENPGDPSDEKLFWINQDQFHMKRGVVEQDITFFGKIRIIPITIYDSVDPTEVVNDGIAFVASS